jgi:diguanylate cyclase (GGDEF)-like protein
MVVPLIVGARVEGTLAAWSSQRDGFDDDDLQILEMLASQVATAVVAAETAEDSDQQSHTDPLTGLPNRRSLARDSGAHHQYRLNSGEPVSVAMLDIDHFKSFNDEYGHRVGDIALQRVAEVIRTGLRDGDRAYRYGGEEFLIVLPGTASAYALAAMERLRAAVASTPLLGNDLAPARPVTVSIGLATGPMHGASIEELISAADRALYAAKDGGRNRVNTSGDHEVPAAA